MRITKWLGKSDDGGMSIFSIFLILLILVFFFILMNIGSLYTTYVSIESKMQAAVSGALEYAMMDEYRADGMLKLDASVASAKLNEYLANDLGIDASGTHYADGKLVYKIHMSSVSIVDDPPNISIQGTVTYYFPLKVLGEEFHIAYDFNITSHSQSLV